MLVGALSSVFDSDVERDSAANLEASADVKLYVKLPTWFANDTPLGGFSPDWAVLVDRAGTEALYFVVETKGNTLTQTLRPVEHAKILCGHAHFQALGPEVRFAATSSFESSEGSFAR
jgi:type III restriction enzyme